MTDCAGCGAALTDDGYDHSDDCRIGRAARRVSELGRTRELVAVVDPGLVALRKLGALRTDGLSDEAAMAALTPTERALARQELSRLERIGWRRHRMD